MKIEWMNILEVFIAVTLAMAVVTLFHNFLVHHGEAIHGVGA